MKKIILTLSIALALISCKEAPTVQIAQQPEPIVETIRLNSLGNFPYNDKSDELTIREIDGCEYIIGNAQLESDPIMCHKGNCKYCQQRLQVMISQAVKEQITIPIDSIKTK